MKKADKTSDYVVVAQNATSTWVFGWDGISVQDEKRVFPRGLPGQYSLVDDRIIQNYLEILNYVTDIRISPFSSLTMRLDAGKEGLGRTVFFFANIEKISRFSPVLASQEVGLAALSDIGPWVQGYLTVSSHNIFFSVKGFMDRMGRRMDDYLSIKEVSDHFWKSLSVNLKSTLHNWMQGILQGPKKEKSYIPVFRPAVVAPKADNRGCRVSVSDLVVVGLLLGTLGRTLKSVDFLGPTDFQKLEADQYLAMVWDATLTAMTGPIAQNGDK